MRGPICPPISTPGTSQASSSHGIAVQPPSRTSCTASVVDATSTVTMTTSTEVAAATAIGTCRRVSWAIVTSPIPTETMPVRKAPRPVSA